jgi:hypothetical protein
MDAPSFKTAPSLFHESERYAGKFWVVMESVKGIFPVLVTCTVKVLFASGEILFQSRLDGVMVKSAFEITPEFGKRNCAMKGAAVTTAANENVKAIRSQIDTFISLSNLFRCNLNYI